MHAITLGLADSTEAARHLASTPTFAAPLRLRVYQHAYRARLLESFHAMFPGLLHALGAELLDAFTLDYLAARPPRHHSIHRAADAFADHLRATQPPGGESWADFIVDLAAMESVMLEVGEAPGLEGDEPPHATAIRALSANALLALRPRRAPCVRMLRCLHPVHDYMEELRQGKEPTMPEPRDCALALTRVDFRLAVRELAPVQWELLGRLDGDTAVEDALREVAALGLRPAPTTELARIWLANFAAQGLLVRS